MAGHRVEPWGSPDLTIHARALSSVPKDMAYIFHGLADMGIDRESPGVDPGTRESLYTQRMSMPWSWETFHDEGPAPTPTGGIR